jgi:hypothetical protein
VTGPGRSRNNPVLGRLRRTSLLRQHLQQPEQPRIFRPQPGQLTLKLRSSVGRSTPIPLHAAGLLTPSVTLRVREVYAPPPASTGSTQRRPVSADPRVSVESATSIGSTRTTPADDGAMMDGEVDSDEHACRRRCSRVRRRSRAGRGRRAARRTPAHRRPHPHSRSSKAAVPAMTLLPDASRGHPPGSTPPLTTSTCSNGPAR